MKKYLLPQSGQFYKANLHSHSTMSDGKLTPDQMKAEYQKRGYSVIAYTDHNIMVPHPELTDENFVALSGVEYDFDAETEENPYHLIPVCHICLIAPTPDSVVQPCFAYPNRLYDRVMEMNDPRYRVTYDKSEPFWPREYTPECINSIIKGAREKGFFVTYNHPTWSLEGFAIYGKYEGMNAMEICNYGCVTEGYDEYNGIEYDELLRQGKRIYCIATDDNHNHYPLDTPRCDSFGGFTMIKAEKLEYTAITDALKKGDFYASMGPEIHELYVEDNKIHIKTSDAAKIVFTTGVRHSHRALPKDREVLNEAEFELRPDDIYVRVTVFDKSGKAADTNAYFMDDIYQQQ